MKYKLIAVDMDGTLLKNNYEITKHTEEIVKKAVEKGIIFTIATGRPYNVAQKFVRQLNLKNEIITNNGAMIFNASDNKILHRINLAKEDAKKIFEIGLKEDTTMCIWSNDVLYFNKINEKSSDYQSISGVKPIIIESFDDIKNIDITKILWYDEPQRIENFQVELKNTFKETSLYRSRATFLEFINSQTSKGLAVQMVAKMHNIKKEEIIAIGDELNDLSMIEYAGLGVAMGNAHSLIKENAQFVTCSNEEEGVSKVIEKFVL